ncbi:MAG TPA: sigma-70 family RNA polymerase sigma factor, partial [Solirubrobacteraceae bacterium]|nr:sigma-70 family RNA polymerase sigma factor [Solirubrobacteraceae bacterium]
MSPSVSVRLLLTQSDARLVAFAQAGHERAYEALVKRYRRALLGYCRRLLLSEERAEDALQQGLLQAWLALRAGTDVGDVKAWLYRIVHNSALNVLRSSGYDYCKLSESLSGADAPQADLDRRIAVREALAGLAALPEMQREALLRTAVEGRTHQQVARDLGLSENALRGLVYRARTTMRAAAGALTPSPLVSWALASGSRGTPAVERLAEIGAGGGAAGVAGLLVKGGAVAVTAGALAGGIVAGHAHPHATAKHRGPHRAILARSVSRPLAARSTPSSAGAGAPTAQTLQMPHSGRHMPDRLHPRGPRHTVRQPSSPFPAGTIHVAPVPVTSNDPKSKNLRDPSGALRGDDDKAHGQGSPGPDDGGATTEGRGPGGHGDRSGDQGSGDGNGSSGHRGRADGASGREPGSSSGGGGGDGSSNGDSGKPSGPDEGDGPSEGASGGSEDSSGSGNS